MSLWVLFFCCGFFLHFEATLKYMAVYAIKKSIKVPSHIKITHKAMYSFWIYTYNLFLALLPWMSQKIQVQILALPLPPNSYKIFNLGKPQVLYL